MVELEQIAPNYIAKDMDGNITGWTIQTTPVIKSPNGTLALSVLSDQELSFMKTMTTIQSLGTYDELFANASNLAIYKSVYPYDVPVTYLDMNGGTQSYMLPERIGEFA